MQVSKEYISPTKVKLKITAGQALLDEAKQQVLSQLQQQMKLPGFRPGKAPLNIVEKNADPSQLQTEFLEQAVNKLYVDAVIQENVRPVTQPTVNITKFVPFTTLEVEAEVEAVGKIKLPDYKTIKIIKKTNKVTDKDVEDVIAQLRLRGADKKDVQRAAKEGDEVVLDFKGSDAKTKESISGADGNDYPLVLGSNTFIPGFESNIVGLKAGDKKSFTLEFPADYGVKTLQKRKVTFDVTIKKVSEVIESKVDDAFAAKVGPFKTVAELKEDIKKQLLAEKEHEAERAFENELIEVIASKSEVDIPEALVEDELKRLEEEEKRNLVYRGQTWQEHLNEEGVTEEEHSAKKRPAAENRVKAGLVLSEISSKEGVDVTPSDIDLRIKLLKGQYQDAQMQAQLDRPENRREVASRLVTEKTIALLKQFAESK